jgi:hypothetical protein
MLCCLNSSFDQFEFELSKMRNGVVRSEFDPETNAVIFTTHSKNMYSRSLYRSVSTTR